MFLKFSKATLNYFNTKSLNSQIEFKSLESKSLQSLEQSKPKIPYMLDPSLWQLKHGA